MLAQPPKKEERAPAGATTTLQLATGFTPRWAGLDGLHERLPYVRYHEDPALRHSVLNRLNVSPAYLKMSLELGDEDSTAKTQGRVFHLLLLEPELAESQVIRVGASNRNAGVYKSAVEHNPGKDVILCHEWDELTELAATVRAKNLWSEVSHGTKVEASLFWKTRSGTRCKARPDILHGDFIADVKTTRDIRYFKRDAEDYGYFRQLAWYADGVEAVTGQRPWACYLVAVCKRTRDFKVLEVGARTLAKARRQNMAFLAQYEECVRNDVWPGYPDQVEVLAP